MKEIPLTETENPQITRFAVERREIVSNFDTLVEKLKQDGVAVHVKPVVISDGNHTSYQLEYKAASLSGDFSYNENLGSYEVQALQTNGDIKLTLELQMYLTMLHRSHVIDSLTSNKIKVVNSIGVEGDSGTADERANILYYSHMLKLAPHALTTDYILPKSADTFNFAAVFDDQSLAGTLALARNLESMRLLEAANMIEGVGFDLEGTSVNLELFHWLSHIMVAIKYNIKINPDDLFNRIQNFIGGPDSMIYEQFRELGISQGLDASKIPSVDQMMIEKKKIYRQLFNYAVQSHNETLEPRPGFLDVLKVLKDNHVRVSIGSLTTKVDAEAIIAQSGLGKPEHFGEDHIVLKENVAESKPFSDVFLWLSRLMRIPPNRQLVIEDSPTGAQAAKRSHAKVFCVPPLISSEMTAAHQQLESMIQNMPINDQSELMQHGLTILSDLLGYLDGQAVNIRGKLFEAGADIIFKDWKAIKQYIEGHGAELFNSDNPQAWKNPKLV
jgi:beta-phosphoglucomutase-like phosphatase (HAD superfamily)